MTLTGSLLSLLRAQGAKAQQCVADLESCVEAHTDTLPMFLDCLEWFGTPLPENVRKSLDEYVAEGGYWAEECADFLTAYDA